MGSARTWRRHLPWLRQLGHVYTFDAAGHGRAAPADLTTEAFVADLCAHLGGLAAPAAVIGHSMGGLHGWCLAAQAPQRVRALVVEDMAPDFRGRTADDWAAMMHAWPQPFRTEQHLLDYFGPVAGQYFLDSFTRRADGWYLHGDVETFRAISQEWGGRDFWAQWQSVQAPTLLLEAEHTITPPGQMARMGQRPNATHVVVADAGHLAHDDQPEVYRRLVTDFLRGLD